MQLVLQIAPMSDTTIKKASRKLDGFEFTAPARARLKRLKKIYGTKKNAIETALTLLEQQTPGTK